MKLSLSVLSAGLLATTLCFADDQSQATTQNLAAVNTSSNVILKSDIDKVSYTVGVDLGSNFKKQDIAINIDALLQGLKDAQAGGNLAMTKEQMQDTLKAFQKTLVEKRAAKFKADSEKNKKEGDDFLAKNKAQPGVVTLPSGLQYKVITPGAGAKPAASDAVKVEYTGRLLNGTVFDSTDKAGKPATFNVSDVIPGWTEALKLMPVGSKWEIYIPADLAYGQRGVGEPIGPNQTLIFQVRLIAIEKSNKGSQANETQVQPKSKKERQM